MTAQQIKWAGQHDWFIRKLIIDGTQGVRVHDDTAAYGFLDFYDLGELRDWAGY